MSMDQAGKGCTTVKIWDQLVQYYLITRKCMSPIFFLMFCLLLGVGGDYRSFRSMYKNTVKNDKNCLKTPQFFNFVNKEIQCQKIHSDFKLWIFPIHFLLNVLIHKIKERDFHKIFCHSLPDVYTNGLGACNGHFVYE